MHVSDSSSVSFHPYSCFMLENALSFIGLQGLVLMVPNVLQN